MHRVGVGLLRRCRSLLARLAGSTQVLSDDRPYHPRRHAQEARLILRAVSLLPRGAILHNEVAPGTGAQLATVDLHVAGRGELRQSLGGNHAGARWRSCAWVG